MLVQLAQLLLGRPGNWTRIQKSLSERVTSVERTRRVFLLLPWQRDFSSWCLGRRLAWRHDPWRLTCASIVLFAHVFPSFLGQVGASRQVFGSRRGLGRVWRRVVRCCRTSIFAHTLGLTRAVSDRLPVLCLQFQVLLPFESVGLACRRLLDPGSRYRLLSGILEALRR